VSAKGTGQDIFAARARIAPFVRHTPLEFSRGLGAHLKLENVQRTGSFKLRGALNRVLSLSDEEKQRGVVAASAGNHAQGVAFGCAQVGVSALIVMPETTPRTKIQATQCYGVEIKLFGASYDDAESEARRIQRETGRVFVSPYNDPLVIAGQGTIALEILQDLPDVSQGCSAEWALRSKRLTRRFASSASHRAPRLPYTIMSRACTCHNRRRLPKD
jgi:threonine dehydratase